MNHKPAPFTNEGACPFSRPPSRTCFSLPLWNNPFPLQHQGRAPSAAKECNERSLFFLVFNFFFQRMYIHIASPFDAPAYSCKVVGLGSAVAAVAALPTLLQLVRAVLVLVEFWVAELLRLDERLERCFARLKELLLVVIVIVVAAEGLPPSSEPTSSPQQTLVGLFWASSSRSS